MPELSFRAEVAPNSFDEASHSVRCIWSTGAPVQRAGFVERLSLDPAHVRLDRLRGASVLDSHQQAGLRNVIGTVAEASVDGTAGHATIRLSRRADVADLVQDIRDGLIRHLSVGYAVARWQDGTGPNGARERLAVDWEPRELSFVAIPADPGAHVRSEETMETLEDRAAVNVQIRALRTTLPGLSGEFIDGLIDRSASIEEARASAVAELQRRQVRIPAYQVGPSHDDPGVLRSRMAEAQAHLLGAPGELAEASREYRAMGVKLSLRHLLAARGEPLAFSMSDAELITRSLTTSDLPILLTETTNRLLLPAYQAAQSPLRGLAKPVTAPDFREQFHARISEAPPLERVAEDGEIRTGPLSETAEPVKVETYARMVTITFQALQNDDLGALGRLAPAFGEAAAQAEANAVVSLITSNSGAGPVMSDTHNLFSGTYHNNVGTTAPISADSIAEAVKMMRGQKGVDGQTPLNVVPRYLIVPAALEFTARQTLGVVYPATQSDVNPYQGALEVLVDARLTDPDRWYIAADPTRMPFLVFASLSGFEGPTVESKAGWEVLAVSTRCVHHFGVGVIDYRGVLKNEGA